MELNDLQKDIINTNNEKVIVLASAASGKALVNTTLVYTTEGKKQIGLIKEGDYVFNAKGQPVEVMGVYHQQNPLNIYEITFNTGTKIMSNDEHLWKVNLTKDDEENWNIYTTKDLEQIFNLSKSNNDKYKLILPNTPSLQYEPIPITIDAFLLGFLIGNCALPVSDVASSIIIYEKNTDKIELLQQHLDKTLNISKIQDDEYIYTILPNDLEIQPALLNNLEQYNLIGLNYSKYFIPYEYSYNSFNIRLELLSGLLNSSAHHYSEQYNINMLNVGSMTLAQQIVDLINSLGGIASIDGYITSTLIRRITVSFILPESIVHILTQLYPSLHFYSGSPNIFITDIKNLNQKAYMTCLDVDDPDHLFVIDGGILTHNTECMAQRIRHLIDTGTPPKKMVAITFTNAMAETLRKRVGVKGTEIFIGTIHSYANYLLTKNGIDTTNLINEENFDELFKLIQENPSVTDDIDYLILDEAQDSNQDQFHFLLDIVKPKKYMLIGDARQSIYSFIGAQPDNLIQLSEDDDTKVYNLNKNYRNGSNILKFAKKIIDRLGYPYYDTSESMYPVKGKVYDLDFSETLLISFIKEYKEYKDWFILARTNAQVDALQAILNKHKIPNDTFKRSQLTSDEFQKKMEDNTVKVLTIHAAKGLEAKYVAVVGARMWNDEEVRISYVAATRAKEILLWLDIPYRGGEEMLYNIAFENATWE